MKRLAYPIAALCALALMGQEESCDTETEQPAKDESQRPEKATPNPSGTFDGTCNYLLGNFTEGTEAGYKLVAGGTIENTGNVGVVATARARWTMLGGEPVTQTRKVRLRRGQSKEIQMRVLATQAQIDAHQAADGKCKTDVTIVDTFGKPVD